MTARKVAPVVLGALFMAFAALALWSGLGKSEGISTRVPNSSRRLVGLSFRPTATAPAPGSLSKMCMFQHCAMPAGSCMLDGKCRNAVKCSLDCGKVPEKKIAGCQYLCEMTYGYQSTKYLDFIKCTNKYNCIAQLNQDGICRAKDSDALQDITSMDQLTGGWWVTRGINCGNTHMGDKMDGGGYDWYPCQHERFVQTKMSDGNLYWQNNITYCGGGNGGLKECTTNIIDTVANVSLTSPGVVHHLYTDSPLMPQSEYWRIVSRPHPDWVFVIWCGQTPLLPYNGGIVLSRAARDDSNIPPAVLEDFRKTAKKFDVDWDEMCPSSNVGCP